MPINYVSKENLQEFATKLNAKQKTIFAPIEAVGAPLVAETAAGMTDETKVYVYTGEEVGYTYGNWYYYDGTGWVSGGVYNATVYETDTTLSESGKPADAKAAGDDIRELQDSFEDTAPANIVKHAVPSGGTLPNVWTVSNSAARDAVSAVIYLDPQQASGTPSESSPKSITGYTKCTYRIGKGNFYNDADKVSNSILESGTGVIKTSDDNYQVSNAIPVSGSSSIWIRYYASHTTGYKSNRIAFYDSDGVYISEYSGSNASAKAYKELTTSVPANAVTARLSSYRTSYAIVMTDNVYSGNISFPEAAGTVYGGYVDITNGKLVVTKGNIASYDGEELPGAWISSMDVYEEGATPTTGAQVVYDLAEPVTYDITPSALRMFDGKTCVVALPGSFPYLNGVEIVYSAKTASEADTPSSEKELYLGEFVNASVSESSTSADDERISTKDCVALPYGERTKLTVHINDGYVVGFRAGRTAQSLSSNLYWYYNGQTVTFSSHEQYVRVIIADPLATPGGVYNKISVSELPRTGIRIGYEFDTGNYQEEDTAERNEDALETLVNAENVLSATAHGGIGTYPVIMHISDPHGDYERVKNALDIADLSKADATVISGDIVSNTPAHGAGWLHSLFSEYNGRPVICTGNHDVKNNSYTDSDVYSYLMAPSAEKLGNTSGKTYYYTDIAAKKLRIISCDLYQYGGTTRDNTHMTSEQLAYICEALVNTPANYGVLIVSHTPCVDVAGLVDSDYSTFFQPLRKYGFTHYDISGTPLYDIVDAFIGRTTIEQTYTQTGSPSSISVSANFSTVPSSVEFIAHLTGHIHEDSVCYLDTTHMQLMLNIACGVAMTGGSSYPYLADDCDVTRIPYGKTQDLINAYVIDRTAKKVKIVRIGGTKTYDRKTRDYMEIPYAE